MGDNARDVTSVTDHRTQPKGVLPRRTQSWIMVGLAIVILAIIVFTGKPEPTAEAARSGPTAEATANPATLRGYQDRLREFDQRRREQAQDTTQQEASARRFEQYETQSAAQPADPLEGEKRRREYESLFASNVVMSRRLGREGLTAGDDMARARSTAGMPGDALPTPPSLDQIAEAVVRATSRNEQPGSQLAPSASAMQTRPMPPAESRLAALTKGPIEGVGPTHRVVEGTVIDTVLTNRLDGSNAAPVNCLVTTTVYSHSGQHVLIPAGARIVGETKPVQTLGETRLAVVFHRLILPDGSSFGLDRVAGLNQVGDAGLRDQVNHHYWSTVGASGAVGLISGFAQFLGGLGLNRGDGDRTVVIAGSAGDQASQATSQTMNRFLNRLPTVTVREGHRVKVYLTADLELPAYEERGLPREMRPAGYLAGGRP
jgi:type IV secretory pathway VirB10-like protein